MIVLGLLAIVLVLWAITYLAGFHLQLNTTSAVTTITGEINLG